MDKTTEEMICDEIIKERKYQRDFANDDAKSVSDWLGLIARYSTRWMRPNMQAPYMKPSLLEFRTCMLKTAALALAAVEWVDRLISKDLVSPEVYEESHPLVENAISEIMNGHPDHYTGEITKRFLERYPEMFDPKYYMTGPVSMFPVMKKTGSAFSVDLVAVEARSKKLDFTLSLQPSYSSNQTEFEKAILDQIVEELKLEYDAVFRDAEASGCVVCPFVIVQAIRSVDPMSFMPMIGFKARYGLLEK